ncbi:phospholipase D-like domain-containing protein [Pseudomonas sp. Irchel 3E20]|uniref:phospholipase D-like domain-containing protein n=1 Tax=Pseudomonas sp. Irchel 3E20 TaxID=2008983 RepID=UPI000BA36648|nr:phospholipase D-like domain-containing protein [Pseudomonas sp. Irchel 3E20]
MTIPDSGLVPRTVCQIVDSEGNALKAFATDEVWVRSAFSEATRGNAVKPYFTGKDYFAELIDEFANAKQSICIAGWQVNWDAQLAPDVRLYDCLLAAAQRGVMIYVMPWDDSAPVQTYDEQTRNVLQHINREVKAMRVFVTLAKSMADKARAFYSHHQKQVVIDQRVAFVGGLDLAYGRYDDDCFDLRADSDGRQGMNRYNGCVPQLGELAADILVNPDELPDYWKPITNSSPGDGVQAKIKAGAYQTPYAEDTPVAEKLGSKLTASVASLDPKCQPRMPWQDIHLRIEGPAVSDLARNFVLRWNSKRTEENQTRHRRTQGPEAATLTRGPLPVLPVPPAPAHFPHVGTCCVQVLRSAPKAMLKNETNEQVLKPQDDILRAMELLIEKAKHYIYIEQQFFVSAFGEEGETTRTEPAISIANAAGNGPAATRWMPGDAAALPQNKICTRLIQRIGCAVFTGNPFHVYIVLPVHPEGGGLDNPAIVTQVHWTQQSIAFGTQSLLNGIRWYIKVRDLRASGQITLEQQAAAWDRGLVGVVELAQSFRNVTNPSDEACFEFVTLLNLRNWAQLGDRYVTEQIYVHSKMMIVDDRYALVGSANINDRSLVGERDSELAVLVMDTDVEHKDFLGNGRPQPTRKLAHELRKGVWSKLFGLSSGVRPAEALRGMIDRPGHPDCWKAIQDIAKRNAEHYEAVFKYIPRNHQPNEPKENPGETEDAPIARPASIWPVIDTTSKYNSPGTTALEHIKKHQMPFEASFWKSPQHNIASVSRLSEIRAFIATYPVTWTKGEDNNMRFHNALMTHAEKVEPPLEGSIDHSTQEKKLASASIKKQEYRG